MDEKQNFDEKKGKDIEDTEEEEVLRFKLILTHTNPKELEITVREIV